MKTPDDLALRMEGVSKRFPGTLAVDGVDFAVRRGETHALMGENGAGKSTLMNILAGSFADYTGRIFVNGYPVKLHSPAGARAAGIGMIHQELSLAPPLSVAENVLAGRLPARCGLVQRRKMMDEARRALQRVELDIDVRTPVEELSQHQAQLVEIAKAIAFEPAILVLDEPTSALSSAETARLFEIVRQLKSQGLSLIYISHHLHEIFEVADRVTVLRDGRRVETQPIENCTPAGLGLAMVGRSVARQRVNRTSAPGAANLQVAALTRRGFFREVSFSLRRGEVLGLAGLAGAGRSEIARSLCAIDGFDERSITLDGRPFAPRNLRQAMGAGMVYLSEDRKSEGLAPNLSLLANFVAPLNALPGRVGRGAAARTLFGQLAAQLQLTPADPLRRVRELSGGNQQKLLLAKWMATEPTVLLLDEPTRGVDIGAKEIIHQAIGQLADAGKSILLITSDLPEMVTLCDRVAVLRKGRIIGELSGDAITEERILLAMNGELPDREAQDGT